MAKNDNSPLKAPWPAFGGKWPIAREVWRRFGRVHNYVEPFVNSAAVAFNNPAYNWALGEWTQSPPPIETLNDLDPFIANALRAIAWDPERTAEAAEYPVSEVDLEARHKWLLEWAEAEGEILREDPHYFSYRAAAYWLWGMGQWIGSGFCNLTRYRVNGTIPRQRPNLSSRGMGIHSSRIALRYGVADYFIALARRLRYARIICGDWTRVTGRTTTYYHNSTRGKAARIAVFLDPPYGKEAERMDRLYGLDSLKIAQDVREYAIAEGDNPKMRIALCGYEAEHAAHMPDNWTMIAWSPNGGYANAGDSDNKTRERIWFSPHCVDPDNKETLL